MSRDEFQNDAPLQALCAELAATVDAFQPPVASFVPADVDKERSQFDLTQSKF